MKKISLFTLLCFALSGCITPYEQARQQRKAEWAQSVQRSSELKVLVRAEKQKYIDAHPGLPAQMQEAILNKGLVIGMNAEQVRMSLGNPKEITKTTTVNGIFEQWQYYDDYSDRRLNMKFLSFNNGILMSWTE